MAAEQCTGSRVIDFTKLFNSKEFLTIGWLAIQAHARPKSIPLAAARICSGR